MKVLLLQDQDEVRERVVFSLESQFSANVIEVKTVTKGLDTLRAEKDLNLIIFDYSAGTPEIFQSFWAETAGIPCIVCVQKKGEADALPSEPRVVGQVERANLFDGILSLIQELVDQGELKSESKSDPGEYCRIRTSLLLSVSPLKADIYIRLSDTHFVKLFRQGDTFDRQDLQKYTIKKGVEYLFLKANDTGEFVEKYRAELEKLLKMPNVGVEALAQASTDLHETAHSLIASVGFTPEVQELAKAQVQLTTQVLRKSPGLDKLWARLQGMQGKYLHTHSTLCAYFSCSIANGIEWASDSTYQKLSLASFMHDIALSNNELARIRNLEELEAQKARFTPEEYRDYKSHPAKAAQAVSQMPQVLPDVDRIIQEHHEWPDGSGFPRKLSHTNIHPLSSVFIVAHDLVDQLLDKKTTVESYVAQNQNRFSGSHFKKILKSMSR